MRLYRGFLDACGLAAGGAVAALAILVTVDVAARNLGWFNLPWLLEIAEYALYGVTFLAAPWVLHQGAHVHVDVLVKALPARSARLLDGLMNGVGLAVSLMLVYYGALATWDAYRLGSLIFKVLIVPEWTLLWIMPLSGALLAIEFVLRLRRVHRSG